MEFIKNFDNEVAFNNEEELREEFVEHFRYDGVSSALYEMCEDDYEYLGELLFVRNADKVASAKRLYSLREDVINHVIDASDLCWYVTNDERRLPINKFFSMDTLIEWIIDDQN